VSQQISFNSARAAAIVAGNLVYFRPGFGEWLASNWPLYERFETEALKIAKRREHYGANTIIEYLRHETMLADTDAEWKMNDAWTSSLARLFAMLNPSHDRLFEFRERKRDGVVLAPSCGRKAA
jgi:hypothetical protein